MKTVGEITALSPGGPHGRGARIGAAALTALHGLPVGPDLGDFPPLPPLAEALQQIDRVFGLERILQQEGTDRLTRYYTASEWGYRRVHSTEGCMHLALSAGPVFDPADFGAQSRMLAALIRESGARRVLELGSGHGFNLIKLAMQFPEVRFSGLDILPRHVANASRAASDLPNVSFHQGSFDDPPPGLHRQELIFVVEALCHSRDLPQTIQATARFLAEDGLFVIFDALRASPLSGMTQPMATAVRLYETTTTVSRGFRTEEELVGAFVGAGLAPIGITDATRATLPGVRRLYGYGRRFFQRRGIRLLTGLFPRELRRNACGALLGPYLVEGEHLVGMDLPRPGLRYVAAAFSRP